MLARFSDYIINSTPTADLLEEHSRLLPLEMFALWQNYGFRAFRDGCLKIVNPDDFSDLLAEIYRLLVRVPVATSPIVLLATAMGDLLLWEDGFLTRVDYRPGETEIIRQSLNLFSKIMRMIIICSNSRAVKPTQPPASDWACRLSMNASATCRFWRWAVQKW